VKNSVQTNTKIDRVYKMG